MARKKKELAAKPAVLEAVSYPIQLDRSALVVCAVLLTLIAGVFAQTLTFGSISLDESLYGSANPFVAGGISLQGLRYALTATPNYWQPGAFLAHMIDFQMFGARFWGHHLVSVVLHCANTLMLFLLLRALSGSIWPSAWVAAVFAIHPAHVEPVAWVTARRDLLSTLFGLLAILAYVRYREQPSVRRYVWIAVAMFAAVATKPVMVVLPVLLLALDIWPLRRRHSLLSMAVEKVPLFVISGLFTFLALFAYQQGNFGGSDNVAVSRALPGSYAMGFYGFYLLKFFWPDPLSFDYAIYGYPHLQALQIFGVCALVSGAWFAFRFRSRMPWILSGLLWWIAALAPTLGMGVADRFTYLPSIGLSFALAWTVQRAGKAAALAAVASILPLALLAFQYTQFFTDSVPLYSHAIEVTDGHANYARMWLANVYLSRGNLPPAAEQFETLIKNNPGHFAAHLQLAHILLATGDTVSGMARLNQAMELRPNDPAAHVLAARYLQDTGQLGEAVKHYNIALQLDPGNVAAKAGSDSLSFLKTSLP